MRPVSKLPKDVATFEAHIRAGLTQDDIARIYSCHRESVRRKLVRFGLAAAVTRSTRLAEARSRERPAVKRETRVNILPDRITYMRTFLVQGTNYVRRPVSVPRISMHVDALMTPFEGERHRG